jgi:hypothetical protein
VASTGHAQYTRCAWLEEDYLQNVIYFARII